MRLGPLFRGTFEVQAGNRPLQGQSKPPVFTGGFDLGRVQMKKPPSPIEKIKSYEKINVSRETLGG